MHAKLDFKNAYRNRRGALFVRLELKPSVTAGVRQDDIKLILLRQQT